MTDIRTKINKCARARGLQEVGLSITKYCGSGNCPMDSDRNDRNACTIMDRIIIHIGWLANQQPVGVDFDET